MNEEETTKENATIQLTRTLEWVFSFLEEKGLKGEFVMWVSENKHEEVIEMVGFALGDDVGKSLGTLMGALKRLDKEAEG